MAPHSSTLAWKIPWMEEPGRLKSMGSQRVGHDWATSLSLFTFMHWRRKWQPTPVFLPGESQGWGSLMGCRLWGRTESDTTEATQQQQQQGKTKMLGELCYSRGSRENLFVAFQKLFPFFASQPFIIKAHNDQSSFSYCIILILTLLPPSSISMTLLSTLGSPGQASILSIF